MGGYAGLSGILPTIWCGVPAGRARSGGGLSAVHSCHPSLGAAVGRRAHVFSAGSLLLSAACAPAFLVGTLCGLLDFRAPRRAPLPVGGAAAVAALRCGAARLRFARLGCCYPAERSVISAPYAIRPQEGYVLASTSGPFPRPCFRPAISRRGAAQPEADRFRPGLPLLRPPFPRSGRRRTGVSAWHSSAYVTLASPRRGRSFKISPATSAPATGSG